MFKKILLVTAFCAVGFLFWKRLQPTPIKRCANCNVILISLDALRADMLPCYGSLLNTAPNLCKYATENIQFNNFYTQTSFTLSSHFSIFTSLYPDSHQLAYPFTDVLNPNAKTLTEILKLHGYETMYVGTTIDPYLPLDRGLGRGFDHIKHGELEQWNDGVKLLIENSKKNIPTFLFLHTYKTHAPYLLNPKTKRLFTSDDYPNLIMSEDKLFTVTEDLWKSILEDLKARISSADTDISRSVVEKKYIQFSQAKNLSEVKKLLDSLPSWESYDYYFNRYFRSVDPKDPKQIEYLKAMYAEVIYNTDAQMGVFLESLKSAGVMDKTIILITSDHGDEFMEHGNFDHAKNIYNTSTHVPTIMSVPGLTKKSINALAQSIDIYPTLLGLLGIEKPKWIQGLDYSGLLFSEKNPAKNSYIFSNYYAWSSAREDKWKLYSFQTNKDHREELYDMSADPFEQKNSVDAHPEEAKRLREALEKFKQIKPPFPKVESKFPDWIDKTKREKLIKEGYF